MHSRLPKSLHRGQSRAQLTVSHESWKRSLTTGREHYSTVKLDVVSGIAAKAARATGPVVSRSQSCAQRRQEPLPERVHKVFQQFFKNLRISVECVFSSGRREDFLDLQSPTSTTSRIRPSCDAQSALTAASAAALSSKRNTSRIMFCGGSLASEPLRRIRFPRFVCLCIPNALD